MHFVVGAMRYYDEEDPKKPRPVRPIHKGDGAREAQESEPHTVGPHGFKDRGRDEHRHVHRC
jgi:hypothetical protein